MALLPGLHRKHCSTPHRSHETALMSLEEGTAAGQLSRGERRTGTNADSSRTGTVVEIKEVIKSIKEGSRSPHVKKILTKPLGTAESWITFVSWIISISIDPLLCYIAVISDEKKLLEINKSLLTVLLVLFVVLYIYRFRIYVQQVHAGSLDRELRVVFILAEFITPLLANGLMMFFINSTISIKASIFSVAMIIFLVLYSVRVFGIFKLFTEEVTRTSGRLCSILYFTYSLSPSHNSPYCQVGWASLSKSGFGQNLEVSTHAWENIFVIVIAIYGMGTFTFFIGNMQSANKRLEEKRHIKEEIRQKQQEIKKWVPFGKLSEKLQNVIMEYQQYNWHGDVDVKNLLSNLPKVLQNDIKHELCLELLKKVENFRGCSEASLLYLSDSVKPVVYAERSYIVREGDLIDKMLFVLQGKLWTFSSRVKSTDGQTNTNVGRQSGNDLLKDGEFGEENLSIGFKTNPHPTNLFQTEPCKHLPKLKLLFLQAMT
ncbi:hypothetical protein Ddye_014004 [Dipteronia dyeriana]|uniref:Cyclic nucleotide-binding domain-containing protein n=1 Tax=Dipteronia dyeriana TaxID=168575 RepID=A0AAE0CKR3_9ROSI|nr:hypothetical protein Ddye_014004 [Dipteronia dyeriana]